MLVDNILADSKVCVYSEEKFSSTRMYPLMNRETRRSCSALPGNSISKDSRYRRVLAYTRNDILDDNHFTNRLLRLPGFSNSHLYGDFSMFARGYIHWADQCVLPEHGTSVDTIVHLHGNIGSMKNYFVVILLLVIVFLVLNCVTLSSVSKAPLLRYSMVIKGKVFLVLNYAMFLIIFYSKDIQNQMKEFIDFFNRDVCSDHLTNAVLRESFRLFSKVEGAQNFILKMSKFFISVLIIFSFCVFCPLIYKMILIKIKLVSI